MSSKEAVPVQVEGNEVLTWLLVEGSKEQNEIANDFIDDPKIQQ